MASREKLMEANQEKLLKTAALGAVIRIMEMIFQDPNQPIKNCRHLISPIIQPYIEENDKKTMNWKK